MNLLIGTIIITCSWASVQCDYQTDKWPFLRKSSELNKTQLSSRKQNKLEVSDRELIREVVLSSYDTSIPTLSDNEMRNDLGDSKEFTLRRRDARRRRDAEEWTATNYSVEDIDHDSKEFSESGSERRSPQNIRYQNSDDGREPQNNRSDGQRFWSTYSIETTQMTNKMTTEIFMNKTTGTEMSTETPTSTYSSETTQMIPSKGDFRNKMTTEIFMNKTTGTEMSTETSTSTDSIETTQMIPSKGDFRNKMTTEIFMNKKTTGTEMSTETPTTTQEHKGLFLIFPGTKWCGVGDRAKSYTDLGSAEDTDKCCRDHDGCKDFLAPKETRHNLTNTAPFYKFSCECEEKFYECLNKVNNTISSNVGRLYFNIIRRNCYREDYPETKECKKYRTLSKLECLEYKRDENASPVYTWVTFRKYSNVSISPGNFSYS